MEQFQQETFIRHFSHPHPLKLITYHPILTLAPPCAGCKLNLSNSGTLYSCTTCVYSLHRSCGEMPQIISHPSHTKHPLTLLPKPAYGEGRFCCDACGERGTGFTYNCKDCDVDLHIFCAVTPLSLNHESHTHKLDLSFEYPYKFRCGVCKKPGSRNWIYRCGSCQFDVHFKCARSGASAAPQPRPEREGGATSSSSQTQELRQLIIEALGPTVVQQSLMPPPRPVVNMPQIMSHPFHREHALTLLPKPAYSEGRFICDACGGKGNGLSYHCEPCNVDLHTFCAFMPLSLIHESHKCIYELELSFGTPSANKNAFCVICKCSGSRQWLYRCRSCGFHAHFNCARSVPPVQGCGSVQAPPKPVERGSAPPMEQNLNSAPVVSNIAIGVPVGPPPTLPPFGAHRENNDLVFHQENNSNYRHHMRPAMPGGGGGGSFGRRFGDGDGGLHQGMQVMSAFNNSGIDVGGIFPGGDGGGGQEFLQAAMDGGGGGGVLDSVQSLLGDGSSVDIISGLLGGIGF